MSAPGSVLEARGVTKTYGGIAALQHVDFTVEAAEIVGIVGPNGAGKTTLFDCLLGVTAPDRGEVRFLGRDVSHLPVYRRARLGLARTFQRLELFPELTPREHLRVALRAHRAGAERWRSLLQRDGERGEGHRIGTLLELVGLADVADTPVEALGLGFGRLVELGRAVAADPVVLLLDEPSSGLDRSETHALADVVEAVRHANGTAVVLVEHDLDLVVRLAERMYVLDAGRVLASGPPGTVMSDPAVRRAYLGEVA